MRINLQTLNVFSINNVRKINNNLNFTSSFVSSPLKADTFEKTSTPRYEQKVHKSNKKPRVNKNGDVREATDFEVKKIHNIECPACEKITMNTHDIEEYKKNVAYKKGQDLINALDKYGSEYYWTGSPSSRGKTIYRENVEGIIEVVKNIAAKNPQADLKQIVKIAAADTMPELVGKQIGVLSEIEAFTMNNIRNKNERENIFKITEEFREIALDRVPNKHFKRKNFLYEISSVYISDLDKKAQINEIAKKLPASTNDKGSFFVKYASDKDRGVEEIASRFVIENRPTGEHIDCFSNGGASDMNNYICDCAYCNSTRGDTSFKIWARTIPHFQTNLQKYLDTVQQNIDGHALPDNYKDYTKNIIKVIDAQSDGEIKLMHPYEYRKVLNEEFKIRTQIKNDETQAEVERLRQELAELKGTMAESFSKSAKLRLQLNRAEDSNQRQRIKIELKKCTAEQTEYKNEVASLKQKIALLNDSLVKN